MDSFSETKPQVGAFTKPTQSGRRGGFGVPFVKGDPRAGRPKGRVGNLTLQQREVAAMVLGKPGTPEFDAFVERERATLLAGTMHPSIKQLWLSYLLGKPKEHVEVKHVENFDGLSEDVLHREALELAQSLVAHTQQDDLLQDDPQQDDSVH